MHPRSSASSTARWVAGRNAVHCPSRYARARWFTGKLMVRGGLASRLALDEAGPVVGTRRHPARSEERRVGEEGRTRGGPDPLKKKRKQIKVEKKIKEINQDGQQEKDSKKEIGARRKQWIVQTGNRHDVNSGMHGGTTRRYDDVRA